MIRCALFRPRLVYPRSRSWWDLKLVKSISPAAKSNFRGQPCTGGPTMVYCSFDIHRPYFSKTSGSQAGSLSLLKKNPPKWPPKRLKIENYTKFSPIVVNGLVAHF